MEQTYADALAAALSHDVAIVFLDVEMPGIDGVEVCRRLRAAKRMSLPIVMVTGRDDETAINQAFDAGAIDFIAKPVNWSLLPHRLVYIARNADREAKVLTLVEAMPGSLWVRNRVSYGITCLRCIRDRPATEYSDMPAQLTLHGDAP